MSLISNMKEYLSIELYATNMNENMTNQQPIDFDIEKYPQVSDEVRILSDTIAGIRGYFKGEIVISFLKDHSVKNEWLTGNDDLVNLVTGGSCKIHHIERLFEKHSANRKFVEAFETYIENAMLSSERRAVK
jgi:hypothetical protein